MIFCVCFAGLLFFSLRPAPMNAGRTQGLPAWLATWLNTHDELANFLAFGGLGIVGLALASRTPPEERRTSSLHRRRRTVLVRLAVLAIGLELLQLGIPGRVCDPRDVLTAGCGLLCSWAAVTVLLGTGR